MKTLLWFAALVAFATVNMPVARSAEPDSQSAIRAKLMDTFDRPDARLVLDAIVVAGDAAVADWEQAGMGGRALLRQKAGAWTIVLCSGDEIKTADGLLKVGLADPQAKMLADTLAKAEATMPDERLQALAKFEGVMMMEGTAPDQHR